MIIRRRWRLGSVEIASGLRQAGKQALGSRRYLKVRAAGAMKVLSILGVDQAVFSGSTAQWTRLPGVCRHGLAQPMRPNVEGNRRADESLAKLKA